MSQAYIRMPSTFHDTDKIDPESATHNLEALMFYNDTKEGVDVANPMKSE